MKGEINMKRSFILAMTLTLFAAIAFIGCDSTVAPIADTAALNVSRAVTTDTASDLKAVTITGPLAIVDGQYAVLYQGSAYYVKGLSRLGFNTDTAEGTALRIEGEAAPILDRDAADNSLFLGYYLQARAVTVNG
jgi:hypothetical protein